MQARWGEAQDAWAADLARVTGDTPQPAEIEAPDASAILAAAEAWKRGEASDERTLRPVRRRDKNARAVHATP